MKLLKKISKSLFGYKVVDQSSAYLGSYIRILFFRKSELVKEIPLLKWVWLTFVEFIFGIELLESIVTTGSVKPYKNIEKPDSHLFGDEIHLNHHIPSGLLTNLFRPYLVQLLYFKYYKQYLILIPVGEPYINDAENRIDCTRTRFRARKEVFSQLITFRRIYELMWVIFNLSVDLIVYYFSKSIEWALLSAMCIEALRRFLRV